MPRDYVLLLAIGSVRSEFVWLGQADAVVTDRATLQWDSKLHHGTQEKDADMRTGGQSNSTLRRLKPDYRIYRTTKTEMGSPCNENGEYKDCQKNNRMDAI